MAVVEKRGMDLAEELAARDLEGEERGLLEEVDGWIAVWASMLTDGGVDDAYWECRRDKEAGKAGWSEGSDGRLSADRCMRWLLGGRTGELASRRRWMVVEEEEDWSLVFMAVRCQLEKGEGEVAVFGGPIMERDGSGLHEMVGEGFHDQVE
jgi:hypothetical protein